jgi:WXG100 family type VII secretion target
MPQFTVDSESISAAAGAVQGSVAQIREAVSAMYTNLGQLQGVWTGAAAQRFATVADQWRVAQRQMETSLEGIQTSLVQASNVYSQAEGEASRLFAD